MFLFGDALLLKVFWYQSDQTNSSGGGSENCGGGGAAQPSRLSRSVLSSGVTVDEPAFPGVQERRPPPAGIPAPTTYIMQEKRLPPVLTLWSVSIDTFFNPLEIINVEFVSPQRRDT